MFEVARSGPIPHSVRDERAQPAKPPRRGLPTRDARRGAGENRSRSAAPAASGLTRPSGCGKAAKATSSLGLNALDVAFGVALAFDFGLAGRQGQAPGEAPGGSAWGDALVAAFLVGASRGVKSW